MLATTFRPRAGAFVACTLVLSAACAPPHEYLGDRALDRGDTKTAVGEYGTALTSDLLVDFEYDRIKEKRSRLVDGEWGPRLDGLVRGQPGRDPFEYATDLLELRRRSRDAACTQQFAGRVDAALVPALDPKLLAATSAAAVPGQMTKLLALLDAATARKAAQGSLDAIRDAIDRTLKLGLVAPATGTGLERMREVLALQRALRTRSMPSSIDRLLLPELDRAAEAGFVPATPANARARFDEVIALDGDARRLAANAPALGMLARARDDAAGVVATQAEAVASEKKFVAAVDLLKPAVAQLPADSVVRPRLATLLANGAAHHRQLGSTLLGGYRKAWQLALATTLSGGAANDRKAFDAELARLGDGWRTSLALRPTFAAGGCGAITQGFARALGTGSRAIDVSFQVDGCAANELVTESSRVVRFEYEEQYETTERVQVGTRIEKKQTGVKRYQCSKPASLDGYVWTGLCEEPEYAYEQVPVYEDRVVVKVRDANGQQSYPVQVRTTTARVSGLATLTWDDGTVLRVPFSAESGDRAEAWAYAIPPRKIGGPARTDGKAIPSGFGAPTTLAAATQSAAGNATSAIAAAVRAHRAELARREGAAKEAAGDFDGAEDAYVRSVLHDGKATGPAATWFETRAALAAGVVEAVLVGGAVRTVPAAPAIVAAEAYDAKGPQAESDGAYARAMQAYEADVNAMGTWKRTSGAGGVAGPADMAAFFVRIAPFEIIAPGEAGRGGLSVGLESRGSPLAANVTPRYGLVFQDELGFMGAAGIYPATKQQYENGDEESPLAAILEADYALMAGLRTPLVGLYGGVNAGGFFARVGETHVGGFHLEPAARLTLRFWGPYKLFVHATGFVQPILGLPHRDQLLVNFPLFGREGFNVGFSWERLRISGTRMNPDGETRSSLGDPQFQTVSLMLGIRG